MTELLREPAARLAALAAAAVLAVVLLAWRRARRRPPPAPRADAPAGPGPDVLALFGDLQAGDTIGPFLVAEIQGEDRGCIPVVVEAPGGARFRVEVLRRDDAGDPPPAATPRLSLYLAGRANGSATPEEQGQVMLALAEALAEADAPPPRWLLTHRERLQVISRPRPPPAG